MTDQHPITPPPEAVQQWRHQWACCPQNRDPNLGSYIANQASHWGWDQRGAATEAELQQARDEEFEACCAEVSWFTADILRAARRPKPPSLKEQALRALEDDDIDVYLVRRALEALPND